MAPTDSAVQAGPAWLTSIRSASHRRADWTAEPGVVTDTGAAGYWAAECADWATGVGADGSKGCAGPAADYAAERAAARRWYFEEMT